jgi:hypothetical protein
MDVLEHIEDDKRFLEKLADLARPGTHIVITVPALRSLWSVHDVTAGHVRRYEKAELERLFVGLPVSVRALGFFNARLYPLIRFFRFIGNHFGRSVGRGSTDFALPPFGVNAILTRIFAGEARRVNALYAHPRDPGYSNGVSLIAVLERS